MPRSRVTARPATDTTWSPSGEGGERAMRVAMSTLPEDRKVSYINAHGTSTPVGDLGEIKRHPPHLRRGSTRPSARPSR
ncbi:hypothetical protein FLP41_08680 [Paracoccus marcusii]|uniref:hypothetical protein n=1 Tax=Paracoccus marcusii TaxID=59779 RepID=UPI002ED14A5F|nr:hypothetical protein FLP41_08680 [Paracoccus marcusii]